MDTTRVVDPTENVIALVHAAMKRQDDMRDLVAAHSAEVATLRADYDQRLREAETARINAIRAVDVGAVNRAAEVSATQALALAAQVAASAETLRTQVAAAAAASAVALSNALEPIQKDIRDLRDSQSRGQGGKDQTTTTRLNYGAILGGVSVLIALIGLLIVLTRR